MGNTGQQGAIGRITCTFIERHTPRIVVRNRSGLYAILVRLPYFHTGTGKPDQIATPTAFDEPAASLNVYIQSAAIDSSRITRHASRDADAIF